MALIRPVHGEQGDACSHRFDAGTRSRVREGIEVEVDLIALERFPERLDGWDVKEAKWIDGLADELGAPGMNVGLGQWPEMDIAKGCVTEQVRDDFMNGGGAFQAEFSS